MKTKLLFSLLVLTGFICLSHTTTISGIDLNSEVQNTDINSVLNPNLGKGEQLVSRGLFANRQENIKN